MPDTAYGAEYNIGARTLAIEVVATGLTELLEVHNEKVEGATAASRVTNALLLAQALGMDLTKPLEAQKVMRNLNAIEGYVGGGVHD